MQIDTPDYNLPVYAQIKIKRVPVTELPTGFSHVDTTTIRNKLVYQTITDGNKFYACLGNDNKVAFDFAQEPPFILGFERDSTEELVSLMSSMCFDNDSEIGRTAVKYDTSPSGIQLDRQLPSNIRLHGVVFKNLNTGKEIIIKTNLRSAFAKMDVPNSHIDHICYEAKVVRGWYIDRIDTSLPLLPNNKAKNDYPKYNLVNGNAIVDMALPRATITTITGIRRSNFSKLINDPTFTVHGWHAVKKS